MITLNDFKDFSAALESLAIVIATFLGGGWALYQFFSLRALEKAKLDLEKARKDLVARGVLVIDLATESVHSNGSHFLHVQVNMRNIGNTPETIDWAQARMIARRFHTTDGATLAIGEQILSGAQTTDTVLNTITFAPGYITSQSFLILIPQPGVYFIEFFAPASRTVRTDVLHDIAEAGAKVSDGTLIVWSTNKFVAISQDQTMPRLLL
jgi:hypothetical protein